MNEMGFSLSVITEILKTYNDPQALKEYLLLKQAELKEQMDKMGMQLRILETTINRLGKDVNVMEYSVVLKEIPQRYVASIRKIIPSYMDEGMLWEQMMKELALQNVKFANPCYSLAIFHDQVFDDERKAMRLFLPLGIINLAFGAVLVYSGRYGWFYYIDSDNIYHRGPLFWIPVSVVMLLIVAAFAVTVSNRRKLDRRSFYSLIFFAVPPFICVLLQTAFYGTSLVLSGVVLSMLVVFINIQNNRLHTDYLTGLGNRKKLDLYLGKKIKQCSGRKVFSAILIDINNFKRINDTYGHEAGDDALLFAAKMLKRCIRNDDFIARYGGDEFCIVLDVSDENELKEIVGKIKSRLEECSDSGNCTYKLNFSMGYAVYDPSVHRNAKRFIRHIDLLMYENKRAMQGHGFCEMRQNL